MTFEQRLAVVVGTAIALAALIECAIRARRCIWRAICRAVDHHVNAALYGDHFTDTAAQIAALETTEDFR